MSHSSRGLSFLAALFLATALVFGDTAEDYYHNGVAKAKKGDLDAALIDCNKAVELKPDFADAYNARGLIKQNKGDLDGAAVD